MIFNKINNIFQFHYKIMKLVIHFDSIINSNEISNSFQFNYKLQLSNRITKVIDNADLFRTLQKKGKSCKLSR